MQGPARGLIAGIGAWKLGGGGCLGTVVMFFLLFWALGYANC